jgi:tRNA (cmo5U34)-methyltransferase
MDWTFNKKSVAQNFDNHVREQLPWYDLASESVAMVAKSYLEKEGLVYDIGASTGNIRRRLEKLLAEREASFVAIESSQAMANEYTAGGTLVVADAEDVEFEPFSVCIIFLSLMFLPKSKRGKLLLKLRKKCKSGGAIIIVDKVEALGGYVGTVIRRLTMQWKLRNAATPDEILSKELSLSGVQRPITDAELGKDAIRFFQLGEFAGWIIEKN